MGKTARSRSRRKNAQQSESLFSGFSFQSKSAEVIAQARTLLATQRASKRKCSVEWESEVWFEDGVYLRWKEPTLYASGYKWFADKLGNLASEPGQSLDWLVLGHKQNYQRDGRPQTLWNVLKAAGAPPCVCFRTGEITLPAAEAEQPSQSGSGFRYPCRPDWSVESPSFKLATGVAGKSFDYKLGDQLGKGASATVFRSEREGCDVAIKKLKEDRSSFAEAVADALPEVIALERSKHPNIVALLDCFFEDGHMHLVFELGTSLRSHLSGDAMLSPESVATVAKHVLQGLAHLHKCSFVHADIKPAYILVQTNGVPTGVSIASAKIADLGNAVALKCTERGKLKIGKATARQSFVLATKHSMQVSIHGH
eukprot:TRINITY_DN6931_c0_g1_i1.p1 TRINITY_DN6931_c0_g1~~TRINITY_DN6931_c0_g1_i1.p1  ORF type:complete len:369 (-),score=68.65 TRINITY_DN6931_c0_g1_i1:149-1255(-)